MAISISNDLKHWRQLVLSKQQLGISTLMPTSLMLMAPQPLGGNHPQPLATVDGAELDPLSTGGSPDQPGAGCLRNAVIAATSTDLISWKLLPHNPLIPPSTWPVDSFDATWTGNAACPSAEDGSGINCTYSGKSLGGSRSVGYKVLSAAQLNSLAADIF